MTTTTTNGRAALSPPRIHEVRVGVALREGIIRRIAELEQADRDTAMQLTLIRSLLAEYRDQLDQADRAARGSGTPAEPPTP
jgi:hypothetical protein